MGGLGRRTPTSWEHVEKYPLRTLLADRDHPLTLDVPAELSLGLPHWWKQHDQGREGACVGFGCSAMMSFTNRRQRFLRRGRNVTYRYDALWLYREAQKVDEWDDTPPEEGTSVNAACKVLRDRGHRRVQRGIIGAVRPEHGISAYRWARNADEVKAAIAAGAGVAIGVNWYSNFDEPYKVGKDWWIGAGSLGSVRGGHCVALYGYSDRREAFQVMNSWGADYPPVWLPYGVLDRLIREDGEAAAITDR
jgi:hypothetical protein